MWTLLSKSDARSGEVNGTLSRSVLTTHAIWSLLGMTRIVNDVNDSNHDDIVPEIDGSAIDGQTFGNYRLKPSSARH